MAEDQASANVDSRPPEKGSSESLRKQSSSKGSSRSTQSETSSVSSSSRVEVKTRTRQTMAKALYWKCTPPTISSRLENKRWHELQMDLARLNQIENLVFFDNSGRSLEPAPITVPNKAFDFVLSRYIKYCLIAKQLDACYHYLVHPQKRILLRACIIAVFTRILELKNELVQIDQREYHFLEDILQTYDCTQADAELTIPLFIREERASILKDRERILRGLQAKHSIVKEDRKYSTKGIMTKQEAILLIQRQTRYYLGVIKSEMARRVLRPMSMTDEHSLQRSVINKWKVFATRKEAYMQKRELELILNMTPEKTLHSDTCASDAILSKRSRARAKENEEKYELDKESIETELFSSEGPFMAWSIHYTIKQWLLEVRDVLGNFPTFPSEAEGGSLVLFANKDLRDVADDLSIQMVNGKFVFPPQEKKKKAKKEKKIPKKNPWNGDAFEYIIDETDCMREMKSRTLEYTDYWHFKDDSANLKQTPDRELIKEQIRPRVANEIRLQVDELIRQELENLVYAIDRIRKKDSKPGKAKRDKKKDKNNKKKDKGDLTADRSVEELFEELLRDGIIRHYPKVGLEEFICEYSYSGGALDKAGVDPLPSLADVKRIITEFAVLPLASEELHKQAPLIRKLLLAGVRGTGKKLLLNAICHEVGATLFDLTPSNLEGKFDSPQGKKMLMHLIIKVGKALEPTVFWIEECEKMFLKKRNKADTAQPAQWVKILQKTLKKGIKNGDRMMLIGTTSQPDLTKPKKFNKFFDRIIIVPWPDYTSRYIMWKHFINLNLDEPLSIDFDLSSLTMVTPGFTAAAIKDTCQDVVSEERSSRLKYVPLEPSDFINEIWRHEPIYMEEQEKFLEWYKGTPLAKQRQQRIHQEENGALVS